MTRLTQLQWITILIPIILKFGLADVITDEFLFFAETGTESIWQLKSDGSQFNMIVAGPDLNSTVQSHVISLDYDPDAERIYWADAGGKFIKSAQLDGSDETKILDVMRPLSLAVDPVAKLLFYSDGEHGSINLFRLDNHHHIAILSADAHTIRLDPVMRQIYWVETSGTAIGRCGYDGTGREVLIVQPGAQINAFTLDLLDRQIFWSDGANSTIQLADMGTSQHAPQQLIPAVAATAATTGPPTNSNSYYYGIAVDDTHVYYVDWYARIIHRADKTTGASIEQISEQQFQPMSALHLYSSFSYKKGPVSDCIDKNGGCAEYCIPTLSGVTCRCSDGNALNSDNKTCSKVNDVAGPDLIWLEWDGFSTGYIRGVSGDPFLYLNSGQINIWSIAHSAWQWTALDYNYKEEKLYLIDKKDRLVVSMDLDEAHDIEVLYYGTSTEANGIAVDWTTGNVYWTDADYNWIMLLRKKGTKVLTKALLRTGMDQPHAIALHPAQGLMFWTDWGSQDRIEMASMDGTNRTILVDTYLTDPMGLAIDYINGRIFWSNRDSVESVDLDGSNRRTYVIHAGTNFVGLAYHETYIFATTRGESGTDPHVWFYSSNHTDENGQRIDLARRPYGITMFHQDRQPDIRTAGCSYNNGFCEHFCVATSRDKKTCLCADNYELDTDTITCEESKKVTTTSFIFSVGDRLCSSSIRTATATRIDEKSQCFFAPSQVHYQFHALDFNHYSGDIYFSEVISKVPTIRRASFKYQVDNEPLFYGTGVVNGLAYDWLNELLYWTDSTYRTISVANVDKSYQKTLITLDNIPHAIVVDPTTKFIYWTELTPPGADPNDPGSKARIMKAPQSLTEHYSIVHDDVTSPTGLAIDFIRNRLVWVDNQTRKIESVDFNGRDRKVLPVSLDSSISTPYDIAIFQDYIVVSDQYHGSEAPGAGIRIYEYVTGVEVNAGIFQAGVNSTAYSVVAMDPSNQPFINHGAQSCSFANGGCEQLCLPASYSYQCACMNGLNLGSDGLSCIPKFQLKENIHLVADDYSHMIFKTTENASTISAIHFPPFDRPIAVAFDAKQHIVYWSNFHLGQIRKMSIDATTSLQAQTILEYKNISGARIDGLVFEPTSRILYYADLGRNLIAIVNPTGTYQKILIQDDLVKPRTIILHSERGHMYFGQQGKIERADMDGSNRRLVASVSGWASGIAIDFEEERVYWCDQVAETIEVADLEPDDLANNNQQILRNLPRTADPFSIMIYGDYLYWTDWSERGLFRMHKTGGDTMTKMLTETLLGSNDVLHIADYKSMITETVCSIANGGCSHFCIPKPGGRICACPDTPQGPVNLGENGLNCSEPAMCPLTLPNGHWEKGCRGAIGTGCKYKCNVGFAPITLAVINCTVGLEWSIKPESLCTDDTCPLLIAPDFATLDGNCPPLAGVGTICYQSCKRGYRMVGGMARRTCVKTPGGGPPDWDGTAIECVPGPQVLNRTGTSSADLNKMIGLGITIIVVAIILAAIIAFALRRRRLKKEEDAEERDAGNSRSQFPENMSITSTPLDAAPTSGYGSGAAGVAFENPGYMSHDSLRGKPSQPKKPSKRPEKRPLPSVETARQSSFENPLFGDSGATGYDENVYETLPGDDDKVKLTD